MERKIETRKVIYWRLEAIMDRAGRLEVKDQGGETENRVNTGQSLGTMRRRG
jgi:hypothetical protein